MIDFRQLSETFYASPQLTTDDIQNASAKGVTLIVNNRPDGEAADQPPGAEIEAAAKAAAIDYVSIPVSSAGFSDVQVKALSQAIDGADGPVLAYCRTGTRSTFLWSLLQASDGKSPDEIALTAQNAGYDISPIRPTLDALAADARG